MDPNKTLPGTGSDALEAWREERREQRRRQELYSKLNARLAALDARDAARVAEAQDAVEVIVLDEVVPADVSVALDSAKTGLLCRLVAVEDVDRWTARNSGIASFL